MVREIVVTYIKAGGPGGQHRNKRETGVRILHVPTGIVVNATERRERPQNYALALERLEKKLAEFRAYYDLRRVHSSLGDQTPVEVSGDCLTSRANLHNSRWQTHCRGLCQLPAAA